jgi:uncharacterized protein (DUF1499 family)
MMSRRGKRILVPVILILLSPAIALGILSALARKPTNLGVTAGRLAPCPDSPNCVCSHAPDTEHAIEPIRFTGEAEAVIGRLKAIIGNLPRMAIVTETPDYLHAEARSLIFRFVDDVEFLVDRDAKLIHIRSASRVGKSDLGVNRKRMEQIRKALH